MTACHYCCNYSIDDNTRSVVLDIIVFKYTIPFATHAFQMEPLAQKILVVGGNGFIGKFCRMQGRPSTGYPGDQHQVHSFFNTLFSATSFIAIHSSSGTPYKTPKGHSPAWVAKVEWRKADALLPETYADILPKVGAVIHTLGTLLEDGKYKSALAHGDLIGLVGAIAGGGTNPLDRGPQRRTYQVINRDSGAFFPRIDVAPMNECASLNSALRVCEAFTSSKPDPEVTYVRPFIYLSAEDMFRPLIPAMYIETKREAEQRIIQLLRKHPNHRGVFIRPSLVYHAHHRPLTSPLATLIDLSASIHASVPKGLPTPSSLLRAVGHAFPSSHGSPLSSPLHSIANALSIPPIHVEHVAEAICMTLDPTKGVNGVVGVREMRELIGWSEKGQGPRLGRA
ncbi:mitochondrial protein [Butyriboletus roseoflavus]|nr:mitochondrial protein [Butyriboletus roseoflavus]